MRAASLPQFEEESSAGLERDRWQSLQQRFVSGMVRIDSDGNLHVRKRDVEPHQPDEHKVTLAQRWLPSTTLLPPTRLGQHRGAVEAIALVADRQLIRGPNNSKQHGTVAFIVATLAKFWEYLFLESVYSLAHVREQHMTELAAKLAAGGWAEALRLRARTTTLLGTGSGAQWIRYSSKNAIALRETFAEAIGTNMTGRELAGARTIIEQRLQLASSLSPRRKSSRSLLNQWFRAISELSLVQAELQRTPILFANYFGTAKALGRAPGRTRNLGIDEAAALLKRAVTFIYDRGPALLKFLKLLGESQAKWQGTERERQRCFQEFLGDLEIQQLLLEGLKVSTRKGHSSARLLNECVHHIYDSCFIVLAAMNARRKNEISHRRFGLSRKSMRAVSDAHKLYLCDFYIEKTVQDYVPFYVNQTSFVAWELLLEMENLFWPTELRRPGNNLFAYRRFTEAGLGARAVAYAFGADQGHVIGFVAAALPGCDKVNFGAHAFRRFYALIFYYRYENSTLQALSHQLMHLGLENTRQYVVDALATEGGERIPVALSEEKRAARDVFVAALHQEMGVVAKEKLVITVDKILSQDEPFAGKFSKLVLRLHAKLASTVDFSQLSRRAQANRVASSLLAHGHEPEPFLHADCMSGTGTGKRSARCWSHELRGPDKSRASPSTCNGCPYQNVSRGHIAGLEQHAAKLSDRHATLDPASLGAVRLSGQIDRLMQSISVRRSELEQAQQNR